MSLPAFDIGATLTALHGHQEKGVVSAPPVGNNDFWKSQPTPELQPSGLKSPAGLGQQRLVFKFLY